MKVTLNDKHYEVTEDCSDEVKEIVNLLNINTSSLQLLKHIINCVSALRTAKIDELETLLDKEQD